MKFMKNCSLTIASKLKQLVLLNFLIIISNVNCEPVFENGFEAIPPRPAMNHAILGHLAGAEIRAYQLSDLDTSIEGPITTSTGNLYTAGEFSLNLQNIPDEEWILVSAFGGNDIDANDDGVLDASPTQNFGTIYALAKAQDWRANNVNITALTDISWRYTKNLIGTVAPSEIIIRQNELAKQFVQTDINEDAVIDYKDVLAFIPNAQIHRPKANFDFQQLHNLNSDGESYILATHTGAPLIVNKIIDDLFGHTLTRFPVANHKYNSIHIKLALFGDGSVSSSSLGLSLNSANSSFRDSVFTILDPSTNIVLTATPKADTHIMNWRGCDLVSNDLTQCTIALNKSHDVLVNFGINTVTLRGSVLDLSRATNTVGYDRVDVVVPAGLTDLIADLAQLQVNDFIVGETNSGFLRKVTAINQVNAQHYAFTTEEAELADVIENGTGVFYKQMVNSDLLGYVPPTANKKASISNKAFNGIKGVKLIPSNNPDSTKFTLQFGNDNSKEANEKLGLTGEVTLYDDGNGGKITATGSLDLEIALDTAFAFRSFYRLKYYRMVTDIDVTTSLDVAITRELPEIDEREKIGDIQFAKVIFYIGPVPIWVTSNVNFYLGVKGEVSADISTGFELAANLKAGVIWDYQSGWDGIASFTPSFDFHSPTTTINAFLKSYIKAEATMKLYGITGPALPLEAYIKYGANASITPSEWSLDWRDDPCFGSVNIGIYLGILSEFKWVMSGDTKIGEFLHLDDLENEATFTIFEKEFPIGKELVSSEMVCVKQPFLDVSSEYILASVDYQENSITSVDVTLKNKGEETLAWSSRRNSGTEMTITPANGTIDAGQSSTVQIAVDSSTLPIGIYTNNVLFENLFNEDASVLDSGTKEVPVTITVLPVPTPGAPIITSLTSTNPGLVDLSWSFDPAVVAVPITRYFIYSTSTPNDPDSWKYETQVLEKGPKAISLSDYVGGSTVSFIIKAYGHRVFTPASSPVAVVINGSVLLPLANRMNDTGVNWAGNYPLGNNLTCTSNTITSPQDCHRGRDYTHNDDSDGLAGFNFTKLDANGSPLIDQDADYASTPWACVKDNVTGLVWEVKTNDVGIHYKYNTYRWGGITHKGSNYGVYYNDWDGLVNGGNNEELCGHRNWRIPSIIELESITNMNRRLPSIDASYFPNTDGFYWTSSPQSHPNGSYAWLVGFGVGVATPSSRDYNGRVRLVSSNK